MHALAVQLSSDPLENALQHSLSCTTKTKMPKYYNLTLAMLCRHLTVDNRHLLTIFRGSDFRKNNDEIRRFLIIFENILKQAFSRSLRIQNIPIFVDFRSKCTEIQNQNFTQKRFPQKTR